MHPDEIPKIMTQIILVGEETGSMGSILKMLAKFYNREVDEAVDTLVGLVDVHDHRAWCQRRTLTSSLFWSIYNIAGGIS